MNPIQQFKSNMDVEKNQMEFVDVDAESSWPQRLSPLIEIEESSFIGSTSEELEEDITEYLQDKTEKFPSDMYRLKTIPETDHSTDHDGCCATQVPVTPPEVLRKQLCNLKSHIEYLSLEHNELVEFTRFERQIQHTDCIPKDKVRSLEDDFTSLNDKVIHLMEDNTEYKNELEQKESTIKELESNMMKYNNHQKAIENTILQIGEMLKENLQDSTEDIFGNNQSLEYLLRNNDFNRGEIDVLSISQQVDSTENGLKTIIFLLERFISNKKELEKKFGTLNFNNEQLNQDKEQLMSRVKEFEDEKIQLEGKLADEEKRGRECVNSLSLLQNKLKETEYVLEMMESEKTGLLNEIENFKKTVTVDDLQHELIMVSNELERIIDSWDGGNGFKHVFDLLEESKTLIPFIDLILKPSTQIILFQAVDKLRRKINYYDEKNDQMCSTVDELNNRIKQYELEADGLKIKVNDLDYQVKTELSKRLNDLENICNVTKIENAKLKVKLSVVSEEKNKLLKELTVLDKNLKETEHLLNIANAKNKALKNKMQDFNNILKSYDVPETTISKLEVQILDHEVKNEYSKKMSEFENIVNITENEIVQVQCIDDNDFKNMSMTLRESEHLKETMNCDERKLQKDIENVKNIERIDDVKNEFMFIFNEFKNFIYSSDGSNKFNDFCVVLQDKLLLPCANLLMDTEIKTLLFQVLDQIKIQLKLYQEENSQLCMRLEELSNTVENLEKDNGQFNKTIKDLESENKVLKRNVTVENNSSKRTMNISDSYKELKTLRKLMALEITSLDSAENQSDLMRYDSVEIFSKLMQIIIKKEEELTSNLQKQFKLDLDKAQETIENYSHKLYSQGSWITMLENENDKMSKELVSLKEIKQGLESKIKLLSNDLTSKCTEISSLNTKVLELSTDNDTACADLEVFKELAKTNKYKVTELTEELKSKSNVIADLKFKLSNQFSTNNDSFSNKVDTFQIKSNFCGDFCLKPEVIPEHSSSGSDCISVENHSLSFTSCSQQGNDSKSPNKNENTDRLEHSLMDDLEKEKAVIKNMLISNFSNTELCEQLFMCSDKLFILKEFVQCFANKLVEMENSQAGNVRQLLRNIESKTTEFNDFKSNVFTLCKEFASQNKNDKSTLFDSDGVISLKKELEFAKEECLYSTSESNKFNKSVEMGQCLVQSLREEFVMIKEENSEKALQINNLYKIIEFEQHKNSEKETKLETMSTQISSLIMNNTLYEEQVKDLQSKISNITDMLSEFKIDFPDYIESIDDKINYLSKIFIENLNIKHLITNLTENITFFSTQCDLMNVYIQNVEYRLTLVEKQKKITDNENIVLKEHLTSANANLDEANLFIGKIISKLPIKILSLKQAVEVIQQIFLEYTSLKETKDYFSEEDKEKRKKLSLQDEELKSAQKLASSLQFELTKCEDHIRSLRSELRNVRLQCQRKEYQIVKVKEQKSESSIQTGSLCCNDLEQQNLEQKKMLETLRHELTSLELQIQEGNFPYKSKVYDLEVALTQAKERIQTLRIEVMQQKAYSKDLIDSYEPLQKYKE